jgi:hypothetical protein
MRGARWIAVGMAAVWSLVAVGTPGAQPAQPGPEQPSPVPTPPAPAITTPTPQAEEVPPAPPISEPILELQPVPEDVLTTRTPILSGPDLFNPPAHQGWLTITPSFTLSGEYNDNLFMTERNRESDFIFGFTPGVTVSVQRPDYRLLAGYNTTGEVYVDNSDLNDFGSSQNFFGDFFYRFSPRVTFALTDRFVLGRNTNALTTGGVSVGRQEALRNIITPRLRFQATPNTALNLIASHSLVRFDDDDRGGQDSDTYRLRLNAEHRLTARLTGSAGMGAAYIDFKRDEDVRTYTPTLGAAYEFTPTLRGSVSGGPSFVDRDGDISVLPAISGRLSQAFKFGLFTFGYDRAVTAETVGSADRHIIFASLLATTLMRGLHLEITPRYTMADRDNDTSGVDDTIKTFAVSLRAIYQIARNISLIGSYTFFDQSEDRGTGSDRDVDRNRVFFGVQYAYPISIY